MTGRTGGDVGMRTAVHAAVVDATLEELKNKGLEELRTESTKIESSLDAVFKAAGDNLDLSAEAVGKVEGFKGSVADRATKVVELHSRLAGVEDLIAKANQVNVVRDEIREIREDAARDTHTTSFGDQYRGSSPPGAFVRFDFRLDSRRARAGLHRSGCGQEKWDVPHARVGIRHDAISGRRGHHVRRLGPIRSPTAWAHHGRESSATGLSDSAYVA